MDALEVDRDELLKVKKDLLYWKALDYHRSDEATDFVNAKSSLMWSFRGDPDRLAALIVLVNDRHVGATAVRLLLEYDTIQALADLPYEVKSQLVDLFLNAVHQYFDGQVNLFVGLMDVADRALVPRTVDDGLSLPNAESLANCVQDLHDLGIVASMTVRRIGWALQGICTELKVRGWDAINERANDPEFNRGRGSVYRSLESEADGRG